MKSAKELPSKGNAYILFGFEAIQARPNLDPYTSTLRTNDETGQVFTSDVHIKHHVRRGLKAEGIARNIPNAEQCVFYEKEDEYGNPCNFDLRLQAIRKAYDIAKGDKKDALFRTLDLPLFGYVHAIKNENFNVTNAANTLFRPVTFHSAEIYSLGRNNAFPTLDKNKEVNYSAGSATVDSLEYGFFLALWEINLNMLRINAEENKLLDWKKEGAAGWIQLLADGMWRAYSSDRFPSFTQRSQFAQFISAWVPDGDVNYANPGDLYNMLPSESKTVKSHSEAISALGKILPDYLEGWGCTDNTAFISRKAANFTLPLPGDKK